jgi:hypothetical protein
MDQQQHQEDIRAAGQTRACSSESSLQSAQANNNIQGAVAALLLRNTTAQPQTLCPSDLYEPARLAKQGNSNPKQTPAADKYTTLLPRAAHCPVELFLASHC